ncbi:MAG: hypothetical protein WBZ35_18440 [Pseudolabrys sp.]
MSVSRIGPAAAHVAAITFYPDANGFAPIARSHVELVARGLEIFLETGATSDTPILSTIPIGSFAGIGLTVVPWPCPAAHCTCITVLILSLSVRNAAQLPTAQ